MYERGQPRISVGPLLIYETKERESFMETTAKGKEFAQELNRQMKSEADNATTEHFEERIPESQGDLADRAGDEIESDLQWRIEMIRRASREDNSRRFHARQP